MIDDAQLARRLMDRNLIARDHLKEGRQLQMSEGTSLYEALIRHQLVKERDVVEVVAEFLNIPCVHLQERAPTPEAMAMIDSSAAKQWRVMPIDMSTGEDGGLQLFLGMEDPLDILLLDDVSTHLGIETIRPVLVGPIDLENALNQFAAQPALQPELANSGGFDQSLPNGLSEMSFSGDVDDNWASFFDDAQSKEVPALPSADISQEMRDRPNTIMLDMMDVEEILDEQVGESSVEESVSLLDEPPEEGGSLIDFGEWDVDESLQSSAGPPPPPPLSLNPAPKEQKQEEPEEKDLFADLMDEMDRDIPVHAGAPSGTMIASPARFVGEMDSSPSNGGENSDAIELNEVVDFDESPNLRQNIQRARPRTLFGTGLGPSDKEIVMPTSQERIEALKRKMFKSEIQDNDSSSPASDPPAVEAQPAPALEEQEPAQAPEAQEVADVHGNSTILLDDALESGRVVMASTSNRSADPPQGEDLFAAALAEVSGAIPKTEDPPQADEAGSRPVLGRLKIKRMAVSKQGGLGDIIEKNSSGLDSRAPSEVQDGDEANSKVDPPTREMSEIDIFSLNESHHPLGEGLLQDSITLDESTSAAPEISQEHAALMQDDIEEVIVRESQSTQVNEVITAEHLKRMRKLDWPKEINDTSLLKAALSILIDQGVLEFDELIERAKALDKD